MAAKVRYHLWVFGVFWHPLYKPRSPCSWYELVISGQSYEIRMLDNRKIGELPEITGKMVKVRRRPAGSHIVCTLASSSTNTCREFPVKKNKFQSIIRVVFHDRRLQYTEHQQLEGWRWNRPGDRILDLGEYWITNMAGLLWLLQKVLVLMNLFNWICVWEECFCAALCVY